MIETYLKEEEVNGVKVFKTYTNIANLKLDPQNPRDISDEKKKDLKDFLSKYPSLKPVLVDIRLEKEGQLIGGNMRLKAYQELGVTEVWIEPRDPITDAQAFEMGTIDNMEFGHYLEDKLMARLKELEEELDLSKLGVHLGEIPTFEQLMKQHAEVQEDEPPAVDETQTISKPGEIYQLGKHRLMCGDSTKIEDVEKLMNGNKADMVFTDPPYGIDLDTNYENITKKWGQGSGLQDKHFTKSGSYSRVIGDDKPFSFKEYTWLECKEQFWWGANYYMKDLPEGGSWFVWDKTAGKTQETIGSEFELLWSKQKHKQQMLIKKWAGAMGLSNQDTKSRVHPTQKPIEIHLPIIEQYSKPEDIILDLFGGSGSTLIACEQLNRACYMMELDNRYTDVIIKRWQNFTNQEAVRISDGKTWNQLSQETQTEIKTENITPDIIENIKTE